MIKKAENYPKIKKIIKSFMKKDWDSYRYTSLLYENGLNNVYVFVQDNRVYDFIYVEYIYGIPVLYPYEYSKNWDIELHDIEEYFKKFILKAGYRNLEEHEYMRCDFKSTINPNAEYCVNEAYYTKNEDLVHAIRDCYENIRFPKLADINDIEFEVITDYQTLHKKIIEMGRDDFFYSPTWKDNYSPATIVGFHYFDVFEVRYKVKYLIAFYKEMPIGIIKIGIGHEYSNGEEHQTLAYIDVNQAYQNRGIAKALISELGKHLENMPLVLTDESEKGKACRMAEHFKNAGYPIDVYTEKEYLEKIYSN